MITRQPTSIEGQALVFILVLLPVFLFILQVVARSGATALFHDRVENHCDRRILNALAIEARGLENLGRLNIYAREIIRARRAIDELVKVFPVLIPTQLALQGAQILLSSIQKTIKAATISGFSASLGQLATPSKFKSKIQESYGPIPLVDLHLRDEEGYEGEIGAPQQPELNNKYLAWGKITLFTERFLSWWPTPLKSPDMILECRAQIDIERLEDRWKIQLIDPKVRP